MIDPWPCGSHPHGQAAPPHLSLHLKEIQWHAPL
jgi:hypothetical protein